MSRWLWLLAILLVSPTLASFEPDAALTWGTDVEEAFARARKTGRPIFAVVACFH